MCGDINGGSGLYAGVTTGASEARAIHHPGYKLWRDHSGASHGRPWGPEYTGGATLTQISGWTTRESTSASGPGQVSSSAAREATPDWSQPRPQTQLREMFSSAGVLYFITKQFVNSLDEK